MVSALHHPRPLRGIFLPGHPADQPLPPHWHRLGSRPHRFFLRADSRQSMVLSSLLTARLLSLLAPMDRKKSLVADLCPLSEQQLDLWKPPVAKTKPGMEH